MRRSLRAAQAIATYPPWTAPTRAPHTPMVPPRAVLPLLPHPANASVPAPPPRQPLRAPPHGFTRTLHAAPSAYPKTLREATGALARGAHPFRTAEPQADESKAERGSRLAAEANECVRTREQADFWTIDEAKDAEPPALWLAAERWRRDEPAGAERGGVTLVLTHACGMQADHWQPTLRRLLASKPATHQFGTGAPLPNPSTPVTVDDIWFIDDAHHGQSVDLNAGNLGPVHLWTDTGREVVNFVQHVLPGIKDNPNAPWQLPWDEAGTTATTSPAARVIGVGHSYGANGLVQAAHWNPSLFAGLFLVEPMCIFVRTNTIQLGYPLTNAALRRRDTWPSRAAAADAVRGNPMFSRWDPDVFDLWLDHSLAPVDATQPEGAVTLATPSWAEAATFTDTDALPTGWDKLEALAVPTGFVQAGEAERWTAGEDTVNEMVYRPPGARNERIMAGSHLAVQECPAEMAEALNRFLGTLKAGW